MPFTAWHTAPVPVSKGNRKEPVSKAGSFRAYFIARLSALRGSLLSSYQAAPPCDFWTWGLCPTLRYLDSWCL